MRWTEFECDQMQLKIAQLQKEVGIWEGRAIKAAAELAEAKQLAASRQSAQWEPIETAPKDGTSILIAVADGVGEARWLEDAWYWAGNDPTDAFGCPVFEHEATAWMPLPSPPSASSLTPSEK